MANVILPPKVWVNLYASTGIVVGTQINSINITSNDVRLASTATEPNGNTDHVPLLFGRGTGQNDVGDLGAWAFCIGGGAIDVKEA